MHTAVLCYIQLSNNRIFIAYKYFFETTSFCHDIRILLVSKRLKIFDKFNLLLNHQLCTKKVTMFDPFGECGTIMSSLKLL